VVQERPVSTQQLQTLRRQVVERFSLEELRALAFDLGIDHERFPDGGKGALARELVQHANRSEQLPALLAQLRTLRPTVTWSIDTLVDAAEPPYRGLDFYREQDAALFFGRARLTTELVERLRAGPFLAVVGASGSGKSSVVRAGVMAALRGQAELPAGCLALDGSGDWAYLTITPTDSPLERLALALTSDLITADETRAIIRDLSEDPQSLRLYVRKYLERRNRPRLFLLVDQFEELFTVCKDEVQRRAFIEALLSAVDSGSPATLVITLRADFYHHCAQYDGLRHALEQRQTYIGAPSADELLEAIVEPARRRGYEPEPGLAELMLRDAGDEPGALPLLSHALLETWARREGRTLTLAGYNAAGGVRGAIARTAERVYGELDEAGQAIAQRIFVELAELGEGTEDTRRRLRLDDLAGPTWYAGGGAAVLEGLVRTRLVTADDRTVQIAHEALIREWPRLREWLDADRAGERLRRGLQSAAHEWDEHVRDPSYLLRGERLATAREWAGARGADLTRLVEDFLNAATAEEVRELTERDAVRRHRLQLTRRALVGVSVFAVLTALAALLAWSQRNEAIGAEATAIAAQVTTASEATRAQSSVKIASTAEAAAQLNAEQAQIERDRAVVALGDSRARLLRNLSDAISETEPLLAERLLLEALISAGSVSVQQEVADVLANLLRTGRIDDTFSEGVIDFAPRPSTLLRFSYTVTDTFSSGVNDVAREITVCCIVEYSSGENQLLIGETGELGPLLSGTVVSVTIIPNSPYFVVNYQEKTSELRRIDTGEIGPHLSGYVTTITSVPRSRYFVINYEDEVSELRRVDNGQLGPSLNGQVNAVVPIPSSIFLSIRYSDAPSELRHIATGELLATIGQGSVLPVPDSEYFLVQFTDAPSDLYQANTGQPIATLSGQVVQLNSLPDSPYFVVVYEDGNGELRRKDTGTSHLWLNQGVERVAVISDSPYFLVDYQDRWGELRRSDTGEPGEDLNGFVRYEVVPPDISLFVVYYENEPAELRWKDTGRYYSQLDVGGIGSIPHSPYFVVFKDNRPDTLVRKDTGETGPQLDPGANVVLIPESRYFIVDYPQAGSELRRTDTGELGSTLSGNFDGLVSKSDVPYFVVSYSDALAELRRGDTGELAPPLSGSVKEIIALYGSPFFVVTYEDIPGRQDVLDELRWLDTGETVMDSSGKRAARDAVLVGEASQGSYLVYYQDDTSEIVYDGRTLIALGRNAEDAIYFPKTNRVAIRYGDGRAILLDLDLIAAIGGTEAEMTLATMLPEELVDFTCRLLFTNNPEWNEARLDDYVSFLHDGKPQACVGSNED
jgi:hypothetical protein